MSPDVVHLDAPQLRMLAHPFRWRLLGALRVYGPSNSTRLAERLETNSGATSYHLRKLADVGLVVEETERGTGRERWWRAAHDMTVWTESEFLDDPDAAAAADWLIGRLTTTRAQWLSDWLRARLEWPQEWQDAANSADYELYLGASELSSLNAEIRDVIDRHRRPRGERPDDAERVLVLIDAFPSPEPRI